MSSKSKPMCQCCWRPGQLALWQVAFKATTSNKTLTLQFFQLYGGYCLLDTYILCH